MDKKEGLDRVDWHLTRPRRRDLFLLLCLVGVVPAFITNTLPTTTWLPGVESFRWAHVDLGAGRWAGATVLLAAAVVGWPLRPRWLWLAALPLLALVTMPADRIGAANGPLHWIEPREGMNDPTLAAEVRAVQSLAAPASGVAAWLASRPPALPAIAPLQRRLAEIEAQSVAPRLRPGLAGLDSEIQSIQAQAQSPPVRDDPARRQALAQRLAELAHERQALLERNRDLATVPAMDLWEFRAQLGLHELWRDDKRARWVEAPYLLTSGLLVLAVVVLLGVGHRVMLVFLGTAAAMSVALVLTRWSDGGAATVLVALQPVFVGTLALLVLRVLARGWLDNREIWRSTPAPALRRALLWTLLLWSPFALVLAVNFGAGRVVASRLQACIYEPGLFMRACERETVDAPGTASRPAPPGDAILRDSDPTRDTLREDLQLAVARQYALFELRALDALKGAGQGAANAAQDARDKVRAAFDGIVRETIFDYPHGPKRAACDLFHLLGCFTNIPLDAANAAYQRPRQRMSQALDRRMNQATQAFTQGATDAAAQVAGAVRDQAARAARVTRQDADASLLALAAASAFGSATLLFVAARAFLLILARLLFAQNKQAYMTMTPRERPLDEQAAPVRVDVPDGDELHLRLERGRLLVKPAFDVDGAAPNTLWLPPQPWRAVFGRIRHRCYWLKEIEADSAPLALTLKSTPGTNFFCWDIPEGAEVAFRWDRFAGMSGTVQVRRVFSLKLGTLVLGHITASLARGPGLLVQHAYTRASAQRTSVSHARVVGWVVGSPFRVESGKSKKNVYVDHCHVVCGEPGQAVHEAAREGRGGHGLWRELLGLLRP